MAKKPEGTNFDKLLEELNGKKNETGGENQSAPVQKKSGFVTLIGRPNVGKSTLMNHLIGQKIAITSDKPQTTRNRIQTVYTDERGQIIFLDTPGIHKAKNKLGEYMVNVAEHTLKEVDLIAAEDTRNSIKAGRAKHFYRCRRAPYCRAASGHQDSDHPGHQQDRYGKESGRHPDVHQRLQGYLRFCGDCSGVRPAG